MTTPRALAAWLDHLRVERGLAANTLAAYERDLRALSAFAEEHGKGLLELRQADLAEFVGALRERGLGPRSQARHLFAVRGFYRFALREGLAAICPSHHLSRSGPGRQHRIDLRSSGLFSRSTRVTPSSTGPVHTGSGSCCLATTARLTNSNSTRTAHARIGSVNRRCRLLPRRGHPQATRSHEMGYGRKASVGLRPLHELMVLDGLVCGLHGNLGRSMARSHLALARSWRRIPRVALLDGLSGPSQAAGTPVVKLIAAGAIGVGAYLITRMAFGAMGKEYLPEKPGPEGYLPRTYDQIFIEECGDTVRGREDPYPPMIPVEYLRALAKKESDFDPNKAEPGHAVGLLQVALKDVLYEYNELYGTSYASAARKDPLINARVACELIGRISRFLPSYAPKAFPKGRFDWTSRREVKHLDPGLERRLVVSWRWRNAPQPDPRGLLGQPDHGRGDPFEGQGLTYPGADSFQPWRRLQCFF